MGKVSNVELGRFYNKSEKSIRNTKTRFRTIYKAMVFYYEKSHEKGDPVAQTVAILNFKGGVGKSTYASGLQNYTPNSVVLNADLGQAAEKINSGDTVDIVALMEEGLSIEEIFTGAQTHYDVIFIDTPGELTDEVVFTIRNSSNFVVPTMPGQRSMDYTKETVGAVMDSFKFNDKPKFCFVVNSYFDDSERDREVEDLEAYLQESGYSAKIF